MTRILKDLSTNETSQTVSIDPMDGSITIDLLVQGRTQIILTADGDILLEGCSILSKSVLAAVERSQHIATSRSPRKSSHRLN